MKIFNWLTIIFWAVLMLYWLASALTAKKSVKTNPWWRRGLGLRAIILVAVILFLRLGIFQRLSPNFSSANLAMATPNILLGVIGVIFCGAGVALAIWARMYLGRNWGMPMTLQAGHELVTSGPYKWVRHPIYSGFLLAAFGSIFADGFFWVIIFLYFGIYFIYSAKTEEKIMSEQFPSEYPAYKKKTKMLIPFVL